MSQPRAKHTRVQHNLVAKRIRDRFPTSNTEDAKIGRHYLSLLALDFAGSFVDDNPSFDPIKFLDACSPDYDMFPMSELWEVD